MLSFLFKRFAGRHYKKFLEKARPTVVRINELEQSYQSLSDDQLRAKTDEFRARLKAGETLMVHGATSGIGVAAIQMAKAAGARVIATSRGAHKAAQALALGADISIDASADDFAAIAKAEGGVDVILDMVGGDYIARDIDAINAGGRLVMIAAQAGATVEVNLGRIMQKRMVLTGSTLRPRNADEKARLAAAIEAKVWPWIEAGKLKTIVDATFPLAEAAKAHARIEDGHHLGKVMLVI